MKIFKTIFIISILLIGQSSVFGQYFGIKLGAGSSGIHAANGGTDSYNNQESVTYGLTYEHIISGKLSVKSGLSYQYNQFKCDWKPGHRTNFYYLWNDDDVDYVVSESNFLIVPLTMNYKLSLSKNIRFVVGAGASFNFLLEDSNLPKESTNMLSMGLLGEAGFELGNFMLGASYDYGMTAYSSYGEKFSTFIISLSYRFGGRVEYFNSNLYTTNL